MVLAGPTAFVITANSKLGKAANDGVGYDGMAAWSVAIEFDTFQSAKYKDIKEEHVGLNIKGSEVSLVAEGSSFTLNNGEYYTAWVDYDPWNNGSMKVFLADSKAKPDQPLLQRELSLCAVLQPNMKQSAFFFGFVASTTKKCACWAYAVVASMKAAYGIALNQAAPRLSVESLFAAMGLTDADKCTAGGSPTAAFEKLVTLDATSGLTEMSDPSTTYPVAAFERALFKRYFGLMLAVRRQPVEVHIEATADTFFQYDGTFKYQDPVCYTGSLNHVVLVVGYFINRDDGSQRHIAPPFWVIRNSWGVWWGDKGHMRMAIQGGYGVCGINVLSGIYPIVKSE
ncbi:unnamed protein product [Closterium sp. NIES-64]|nr:unnamed protein product [Closterium sp. NIES-64]